MDLLRSQAAAAAAFLLRSLPPGVRERIKAALGALGHEPGWAHRLRARHLAQTRTRLDDLVEAIDHDRILQEAEVPRALDGIDGDALVRALARWDDPAAIRA